MNAQAQLVRPRPHLHLPDEPLGRKEAWGAAVLEGADPARVVGDGDGVAAWLWARWSALAAHGMDAESFCEVVAGYRREVWFWIAGDRTWEHCCAGLIGRIARRLGP